MNHRHWLLVASVLLAATTSPLTEAGQRRCLAGSDHYVGTYSGVRYDLNTPGVFKTTAYGDLEVQSSVKLNPYRIGQTYRVNIAKAGVIVSVDFNRDGAPVLVNGVVSMPGMAPVDVDGVTVSWSGPSVVNVVAGSDRIVVQKLAQVAGTWVLTVYSYLDTNSQPAAGLCGRNDGNPASDRADLFQGGMPRPLTPPLSDAQSVSGSDVIPESCAAAGDSRFCAAGSP